MKTHILDDDKLLFSGNHPTICGLEIDLYNTKCSLVDDQNLDEADCKSCIRIKARRLKRLYESLNNRKSNSPTI